MVNWLKMVANNGRERRSESEISSYNHNGNGGGCGWGLINVIKHQHWPHFMRRFGHHKRKRLVGKHGIQELDKLIVVEEGTQELAPQKNNPIKSKTRKKQQNALKKDNFRDESLEITKPEPIRASKSDTPKEYSDALNIISANEEFLVKVLHDPGSPLAHHFGAQHALNTKQGMLVKSQTFPQPGSSGKRVRKPSRFKPVETAEAASESPRKSRVGKRRFKDFKDKIRHMMKDRRKEMRRVAMDATIDKIPRDKKPSVDGRNSRSFESCDVQGKESPSSSSFGRNKSRSGRMTRASSLTESIDRYCQLYDTSFKRENSARKSLDGVKRLELVSKNLKRIYSLPDLQSYLNPNGDSSDEEAKGLVQSRRSFDDRMNGISSKDQFRADFSMESIVEEDPNEVVFVSPESNESTELPVADALECTVEEYSVDHVSSTSFITENESQEQVPRNEDKDNETTRDTITTLQMKEEDKAEFSYVKDILELSGFSGEVSLEMNWHSDNQPLNPSIYEEASKGCLVFDPHCCGKCDHPLLFDLINEVLMEIYAKSYSYYPFQLTSLSHIYPMPIGQHVLGQVWGLISWYLRFKSEVEKSTLDHIVGCDLAKSGHWWMNLQFDSECVGLEIEELIFHDLLEEIILAHFDILLILYNKNI